MNQILYTIEDDNMNNRIKSIVMFFSLFLIIFGLALLGTGGYNIYASNLKKQENRELAKIPQINITTENNKVILTVNHVRTVQDITYAWNSGEEIVLKENKTNGIKEYIDIPAGKNTLNITVTDINGIYSKTEEEFTYQGTYFMDPILVDNNKKIKFVATDNEGLQSISYRWNSEEPVMKEAENTNTKTMEIETEIPVGINTVQIIAINNKNEKAVKEIPQIQGITKPTIKVNYNSDRTLFTIKIKDDQGIESYTYKLYSAKIEDITKDGKIIENFKEKLVKVTENSVQANKELELTDKLAIADGFNYLELKVKNIEGAEEEIVGWCVR